jgi:hypothetical protein
MKPFRSKVKAAALAVCMMAASVTFSLAGAGEAHASVPGCGGLAGGDYFHYNYIYPATDKSLDWWGNGYRNPVELESVSSSSPDDCFKILAGYSNGQFELQLWQTDYCLNIAGDSTSVGAHVILYQCVASDNELFSFGIPGIPGGNSFVSSSSGFCIDLSNGWNAGSILVQKNCLRNDPWQAWSDTVLS